ncbi:MAG: TOBE domain-containing protein [Desulfotignum sp.]
MTSLFFILLVMLIIGMVFPLTTATANPSGKLIIFHAGSLTVPFDAIERAFEAKYPDVDVLREAGGSTKMARLISEVGKPDSRFTAQFVGMKNIAAFDPYGEKLRIAGTDLDIVAGNTPNPEHHHLGIRPENILLASSDTRVCQNHFTGNITDISPYGVFTRVHLELSNMAFEAIWPKALIKEFGLDIGKPVSVGFHPESVHTF